MATMTLNIYSATEKGKIEKTYVAESYDLMLGTVEDILHIIDVDKLNDQVATVKMVINLFDTLKPFLKDVFEGVTDEELRHVSARELIPTFMQIFSAIMDDIGLIKTGKNLAGA